MNEHDELLQIMRDLQANRELLNEARHEERKLNRRLFELVIEYRWYDCLTINKRRLARMIDKS